MKLPKWFRSTRPNPADWELTEEDWSTISAEYRAHLNSEPLTTTRTGEAVNPKTSPQHRADWNPTADQAVEEYDAQNWQRMNGTMLPGWGEHRAPSVMATKPESSQISLEHGMALAGILLTPAPAVEDETEAEAA